MGKEGGEGRRASGGRWAAGVGWLTVASGGERGQSGESLVSGAGSIILLWGG